MIVRVATATGGNKAIRRMHKHDGGMHDRNTVL
jgi:hypothetical protein